MLKSRDLTREAGSRGGRAALKVQVGSELLPKTLKLFSFLFY